MSRRSRHRKHAVALLPAPTPAPRVLFTWPHNPVVDQIRLRGRVAEVAALMASVAAEHDCAHVRLAAAAIADLQRHVG